tara:strand:+ start:36707 stop:37876 length:1170 start_codon:yes stop_codon:yes gene_type:complete
MNRFFLYLSILLFTSNLTNAQEKEPFFQKVESSFTYSADIYANIYGGINTGTRYMDNIDVEVSFDAKSFSFYFYGLGNQGSSISEIVGDIQTISNIDSENSWRFYEAWILKTLPKIKSSLLVGLYDLNSEFDVTNTGGLFLNSSHGIGPDFSSSGITGPSIFPLTSIAARLKIHPIPLVSLKIAVLDAVPSNPNNTIGTSVYLRESEGALLVSELTFTNAEEHPVSRLKRGVNEISPFRLVLGGWKYTEEREGWLGEMESDHGVYAIGELSFANGFSVFGRVGAANRDINRFNYYLGTGLNYSGLFKNRPDDVFGFAISAPLNSDDFVFIEERSGNDFTQNETNIELTYLLVASENVSFQFDAQYIQNPNQAPDIEDAFVIGIRSVFGF